MARERRDRSPPDAPGVVELHTTFAAAPAEVWRAFTTPALTEQWMGGFRMVSSWKVGEPFSIVGRLNNHDHAETGTLLAVEPPTLLRYEHWSRLWRVPDRPEHRAVMTVRIAVDGDVTRVSLRHELPAVTAIVPHSRFFWTVSLEMLRKLLAANRD